MRVHTTSHTSTLTCEEYVRAQTDLSLRENMIVRYRIFKRFSLGRDPARASSLEPATEEKDPNIL